MNALAIEGFSSVHCGVVKSRDATDGKYQRIFQK